MTSEDDEIDELLASVMEQERMKVAIDMAKEIMKKATDNAKWIISNALKEALEEAKKNDS